MAEKVTKIPNQNNINSVITAQIENMTDIIKVVVKAATDGTIKYSSDTIDKLKTYRQRRVSLYSCFQKIANLMKQPRVKVDAHVILWRGLLLVYVC